VQLTVAGGVDAQIELDIRSGDAARPGMQPKGGWREHRPFGANAVAQSRHVFEAVTDDLDEGPRNVHAVEPNPADERATRATHTAVRIIAGGHSRQVDMVGELAREVGVVDPRRLLGQPRRHQVLSPVAEKLIGNVGVIGQRWPAHRPSLPPR
jgi:hypothetical protein